MKNLYALVLNCSFTNNRALWGGGLFAGYKYFANKNTLVVKDTVFVNNTAYVGGGGMDIGFYETSRTKQFKGNRITIENVFFYNNHAWYGGGNTIFSDLGNQLSHKRLNKLTFTNSVWKNNFAHFSTAVDVSPNIYDNVYWWIPTSNYVSTH